MIYKIRHDNAMEKYFKDDKTGDMKFSFPLEFKTISAHKIILASRSGAFHKIFYGDDEFKGKHEIKIVDAMAAEFEAFLRYFYCLNMEISKQNIAKIMYLADKYSIVTLLVLCEDFLKKTSTFENILPAYRLAILFRRNELKQFLEEKIRKQPKEFFTSAQFNESLKYELESFLQLDRLNCDGKDVFDALMLWSENACVQKRKNASNMKIRRAQMGNCLELIPFRSMERKQINEIVKNHSGLFKSNELVELIGIMAEDDLTETSIFKRKLALAADQSTVHDECPLPPKRMTRLFSLL